MSWSFSFYGKSQAVTNKVKEQAQTFSIAEEQAAYESAKATILASLSGCDDAQLVFVQANGSARSASDYSKKACSTTVIVSESPVALLGSFCGQLAE